MGLSDQANKLPGMVSGGQQQRAAIARALANDPQLVVADEPTGNLDSRSSADVFDLFHRLVEQGKTLLMVTHDKELARRVPRMVEIIDGRITRDEFVGGAAVDGVLKDGDHGCRFGYKIFRDFWHHKARTLQIVAIISIGAAAIGMIMGTRNLIIPGMWISGQKALRR